MRNDNSVFYGGLFLGSEQLQATCEGQEVTLPGQEIVQIVPTSGTTHCEMANCCFILFIWIKKRYIVLICEL